MNLAHRLDNLDKIRSMNTKRPLLMLSAEEKVVYVAACIQAEVREIRKQPAPAPARSSAEERAQVDFLRTALQQLKERFARLEADGRLPDILSRLQAKGILAEDGTVLR